jgi:hypothetical protein
MTDPEVEATYREFWASIVEHPDGTLNVDQVKRELHDYRMLLNEVPQVYMHITGGIISKPNTLASAVIPVADEHYEESLECD